MNHHDPYEPRGQREERRTCGETDTTVLVYTEESALNVARAINEITMALTHIKRHDMARLRLIDALELLRNVPTLTVEVDTPLCPFDDDVLIYEWAGSDDWTCPVCRKEHVEYFPADEEN